MNAVSTRIARSVIALAFVSITACGTGASEATPSKPGRAPSEGPGATLPGDSLPASGVTPGFPDPVPDPDPGPDPVADLAALPGLCTQDGWCWRKPSPQGNALHAMWRTDDHLWIVGAHRGVLHWDGLTWEAPTLPDAPQEDFNAVFGTGKSDVWIASGQRIYHFDGSAWTVPYAIPPGYDMRLHLGWAAAPDDAWVTGDYGVVFHYDGATWSSQQSATGAELFTVWGSGASDVWFGGKAGSLVRWDGAGFTAYSSGTLSTIQRIWGTSSDDVWAVGQNGLALHWTGNDWTSVDSGTTRHLSAVHGASPDDVWFAGLGGRVGHWDGAAWTATQIAPDSGFFDIHVTPDNVWTFGRGGELFVRGMGGWSSIVGIEDTENQAMYAAGPHSIWRVGPGAIFRYDGAAWMKESAGLLYGLSAVHGSGSKDVWAVGQLGKTHHFNGITWSEIPLGENVWLNGVWARSDGTAFAVGDGGAVFFFNGAWQRVDAGVTADLFGIWGPTDDLCWAVGAGGTILRYDGGGWKSVASPTSADLRSVHGSADGAAWIVGSNATALRLLGDAFGPTPIASLDLRSVSVKSADLAYAAGSIGGIFEWNGTSWHAQESGFGDTLNAVVAIDGGSTWAAGGGGVLLERP